MVLFCKELDIRCPFEEVADKKWWKKFIVKHPFLYVALFPDHKPQRQPCDWNIDGDDKLQVFQASSELCAEYVENSSIETFTIFFIFHVVFTCLGQ